MPPKRLYEHIRQKPPNNYEKKVSTTFALNEWIPSINRVYMFRIGKLFKNFHLVIGPNLCQTITDFKKFLLLEMA